MKVLVTGVTGFVGKVVLEELLRRSEELRLEKIYVLIRHGKKGHSPQERFHREVAPSPCFSRLPKNWERNIEVVAGELSEANCGLSVEDQSTLGSEVTHIINCAASVEFDLPLAVAAKANILSSLHILEFAKTCQRLKHLVSVSTAYVTPYSGQDAVMEEKLVPLPRPAEEIYRSILLGTANTKKLLRETGHPNTYTLTKCLSEHLLTEKRGTVPLTIVRPSIVSACWRHPFPGWIDSRAAFAGFVALIGSGYLRAVVVNCQTLLDIVPCDIVADRIIRTTFERTPENQQAPDFVHAVAGAKQSCSVRENIDIIENYFRRYPIDRYAHLRYAGPDNWRFRLRHWQWHLAPGKAMKLFFQLTGDQKKKKQIERLTGQLHYLNTGFPYFTHCTFDFHSSMPIDPESFEKKAYIENVCRGVYNHLMKKNDQEVTFAGRKHHDSHGDFSWVQSRAKGNWTIRASGYFARKVLRRCADRITFDRAAFETARASIPDDRLLLIVPTHRSYLDFILCSYLFFAYPELKIAIPHIAAAQEFGKIPILGGLIKKTQAFYVQRGLGKENPELTRQIHDLVQRHETLEFFIEGTRSRARQFLTPRRGILKCLQASRQECTVLPIAISYDRVPEESTFLKELSGAAKPKMRLGSLLAWLGRVLRGEVRLGRIHMSCGQPIPLSVDDDPAAIGWKIMAELQAGLAVSTHHLRGFLKQSHVPGMDLAWLSAAIQERGGKVLESSLHGEERMKRLVESTLRYQWMHHFFPEARAAFPENAAIQHFTAQHDYRRDATQPLNLGLLAEDRLQSLLKAIFEPICRVYAGTAEALLQRGNAMPLRSATELLPHLPGALLPQVESCLGDLVARGILSALPQGAGFTWGPKAEELADYRNACQWPEEESRLVAVG